MAPNRRAEWAARAVAVVATLWFGAAAAWEIAGPFGAGHVASSAALGIAAENMFHWGILAPVTHYPLTEPAASDYYCHHPWGIFWTTALLVKLLGHQDVACRLAPVLMSAATPPLLYGIGRALWSPVAGAVAASAFATLPIALAYANFNALEVPVIFGVLLATWGLVRFVQTSRRRFMLVGLLGLAHALNSDWQAFLFAAAVLGLLVPRLTLLNGRWYPFVAPRRAWGWWLAATTVCAAVLLFYVVAFHRLGQIDALLDSAQVRSSGSGDPLPDVLASRALWIETSFTPLAILLGKLAVPVLVFRVVALRRELEVLVLAILLMATVQYVVFRQGADVHVFWPHTFAPYFALALAALVASTDELLQALAPRVPWFGRSGRAALVAFGLGLLPVLLILPDGVRGLRYARRTGGRFDEKGLLIHQDIDKAVFLKSMATSLRPGTSVGLDPSLKYNWSEAWALGHPSRIAWSPPTSPETGEDRYFAADARFAADQVLEPLATLFAVRVVGPYWWVDRAVPWAPVQGYRFEAREPTALEWLLWQAHDPILRIVPDPLYTWELRYHFGQQPNPAPQVEPHTLEQVRIAHNLAVARADAARTKWLRERLEAALNRESGRVLGAGIELIGDRLEDGVAPTLSVYFVAAGPTEIPYDFVIQSLVESRAFASLVAPDPTPRMVGMPFPIPTTRWRPGFIYSSVSEIRSRPGTERFYGYLEGAGQSMDAVVQLLRL